MTTTFLLRTTALGGLLALAPFSHAATASGGSLNLAPLGGILNSLVVGIDLFVVPFIFAIAFIVFLWGVFQYFIAGGADEEKRKTGRTFVMWGIIGFAVMISVWGLVHLLLGTFGFEGGQRPALPTFNDTSGQQQQDSAFGGNGSSEGGAPQYPSGDCRKDGVCKSGKEACAFDGPKAGQCIPFTPPSDTPPSKDPSSIDNNPGVEI